MVSLNTSYVPLLLPVDDADIQPIFLIMVLWAARPLYKYIFPLGHRHGEGAHTREYTAEEANRARTGSTADTHTSHGSPDVKA